jgi:hypothetical protein
MKQSSLAAPLRKRGIRFAEREEERVNDKTIIISCAWLISSMLHTDNCPDKIILNG